MRELELPDDCTRRASLHGDCTTRKKKALLESKEKEGRQIDEETWAPTEHFHKTQVRMFSKQTAVEDGMKDLANAEKNEYECFESAKDLE